ncbi:WD40 repeat-like protein [Jackrogersella minutella]|nr:WD40 repeat-like protein [Jackrogersella minutella]
MYPLTCMDGYKIPLRAEVYVLDIVPFTSGPATISSDQKLSLFNPASLSTGPLVNHLTNHGNITCAKAFDVGNAIVCTAGEDGSISAWDLRQDATKAEVARLTENKVPVSSLACSSEGLSIAVGTELQDHQASIFIWDVRSMSTPKAHYKEFHSDDVTELSYHPSNHRILLSGSMDGLVNIYDTRITDEDEIIIQTFNHEASIHHAGFLNNTEVFALSHDEKLAMYDVAENYEQGVATTDFGDMREILGCQYIANIFAKSNGAGAVIGAGAHDQQAFHMIHLAKGQGWDLDQDNFVSMPGAHSSEIVRSFCFYDEVQTVYSAGEDGYIKAWRPTS